MRVLFALEGPRGGWTRQALTEVGYDRVRVLAADPAAEDIVDLVRLVEMAGGEVTVDPIPPDDLLGAFSTLADAFSRESEHERACSVNAGKDANLLSAAGLLACLHEGVEAHFLDESGHTVVPVLTPKPLREMLDAEQTDALAEFPDEGWHISEVGDHDPASLNKLRDRGLIELDTDRLVLTGAGRAYRQHVR